MLRIVAIIALLIGTSEKPARLALQPSEKRLKNLEFMSGSWVAKKGDAIFEEHWTWPAGGSMLGMHRDLMGNGKTFFEFLRIEVNEEGVITYLASPRGKAPTPFVYTGGTAARAVFENPDHDYPKRIIYSLEAGWLIAAIDGGRGTEAREWRFQPARIR